MCNIEKSYSDFHRMKGVKDGLRSQCKMCRKLITKKYRDDNKAMLLIKAIQYGKDNKESRNLTRAKWREKNRNEYNKKNRIYRKKYYKINGDAVRQNQQKYRDENKDKIRQWNKEYYHKNIHIKAWRRLISDTLLRMNKKKEGHTIDLLGYSALELKNHITALFTEGMSWDNYGEWHIDHIKPVSKFDKDAAPNNVNALSNLRPLWATTREINGVVYEGNLNKWAN